MTNPSRPSVSAALARRWPLAFAVTWLAAACSDEGPVGGADATVADSATDATGTEDADTGSVATGTEDADTGSVATDADTDGVAADADTDGDASTATDADDSGSTAPEDADGDASTATDADGATPRAALPPWLAYCDEAPGCAAPRVVLAVCPADAPGCSPARGTVIAPTVDGHPLSAIAFPVNLPDGATLRLVEGSAAVIAHLVSAYASEVELRSDLDVTVSYYDVVPSWGGTTALDFASETRRSELLDSVFFRHPSYDTGTAAADLHARGQLTIAAERLAVGVTSEHVRAFFMPMELAAVSGEGNFSYGDGTVTSNYGNPPYIAALGGIMNVAFPRFAHECVHELFDEVRGHFAGDATCLNEGAADALAWLVGDLPLADFGPVGVRGIDFDAGCGVVSEVHDVGNCYFWQVRKAGLLDEAFMRGVFQTKESFDFQSCEVSQRTGDSLLVLFSEAAPGADLRPVIDAIGLPHAATVEAARAGLGL